MFFFAVLALAARLSGSWGGNFGAFLAQGAFRAGLWAWLLLPLAVLTGLVLALPPFGRLLLTLMARFWEATAGPPEPERPAEEDSAPREVPGE
jgi:hypothetical protein